MNMNKIIREITIFYYLIEYLVAREREGHRGRDKGLSKVGNLRVCDVKLSLLQEAEVVQVRVLLRVVMDGAT